MKKKIDIITYHFANNYGAVLQTYATQKTLEKLGVDSEVIDYFPKYHSEVYVPKRDIKFGFFNTLSNKNYHKFFIARLLAAFKSIYLNTKFNQSGVDDRNNKVVMYQNFVDKFLKLSRRYDTLEELVENPPKCDGLVAGSDQIWNWKITNKQYDDAYFLQFGESEINRCVFATSIGNTTEEECYSHVKGLGIRLDYISFREKTVCDKYNAISSGDCMTVCDPTLLLLAEDYNNISNDKYAFNEPYILAYILVDNPVLTELLKKLEERTGFAVVEISPKQKYQTSMHVSNIEPNEFPSFFKGASYVVTNSFHGTAFSLIYNKELFCAANPNSLDDRITSLLKTCNVLYRFVENEDEIETVLDTKLDYGDINTRLDSMRKQSIDYLKESLEI